MSTKFVFKKKPGNDKQEEQVVTEESTSLPGAKETLTCNYCGKQYVNRKPYFTHINKCKLIAEASNQRIDNTTSELQSELAKMRMELKTIKEAQYRENRKIAERKEKEAVTPQASEPEPTPEASKSPPAPEPVKETAQASAPVTKPSPEPPAASRMTYEEEKVLRDQLVALTKTVSDALKYQNEENNRLFNESIAKKKKKSKPAPAPSGPPLDPKGGSWFQL